MQAKLIHSKRSLRMNDKTNELVKQDVLMLDSLAQMQQKQKSFELDQKRKFNSMRLQVEEIKKITTCGRCHRSTWN
jgi:hypothetical protein